MYWIDAITTWPAIGYCFVAVASGLGAAVLLLVTGIRRGNLLSNPSRRYLLVGVLALTAFSSASETIELVQYEHFLLMCHLKPQAFIQEVPQSYYEHRMAV